MRRPELIGLLLLDRVVLSLADLFQLTLALVALDFSTWFVLLAFYERIKDHRKQVGWLKFADVYMFISGFFFVFYIIRDVTNLLTNLNPVRHYFHASARRRCSMGCWFPYAARCVLQCVSGRQLLLRD
jgi:hypothetical protein